MDGRCQKLGVHSFSISNGKTLGTKLLQATLSGFICAYPSLCKKSCENNSV